MAKVASEQAKPRGLVWVPPGSETSFLAPLSVRRIPGIGRVTEAALKALGIETIVQLQAMELAQLEDSFGRWGTALYRKARGIDSYEFFVDAEPKSISHNQTFGEDTNDRQQLESALSHLCQKACKRLRDAGLHASTVTLTLRFTDFKTITRSHTLAEPCDLDAVLLGAIRELFSRRVEWFSDAATWSALRSLLFPPGRASSIFSIRGGAKNLNGWRALPTVCATDSVFPNSNWAAHLRIANVRTSGRHDQPHESARLRRKICRTLRAAGHQAYFVGGCVRDILLGREPADYDVATDATPDRVQAALSEQPRGGREIRRDRGHGKFRRKRRACRWRSQRFARTWVTRMGAIRITWCTRNRRKKM